jgi:hypothetical protein
VSTMWIVLIVIGAVVVIGVVSLMEATRRRRVLRRKFGAEFDRLVEQHGDRHRADAALRQRVDERGHLDIRPLAPAARGNYANEWRRVQAEFVDTPRVALSQADALVTRIMNERGYPVDDFDHQAAAVSVDHPDVVKNYREGHHVFLQSMGDGVTTEEMRRGFVNYRVLFLQLLDEPAQGEQVRQ